LSALCKNCEAKTGAFSGIGLLFPQRHPFFFYHLLPNLLANLKVSAVWEPCSFGLANEGSILRKEVWDHTTSDYIPIKFV